jgi:inorganic phosphate transporter, PiT family
MAEETILLLGVALAFVFGWNNSSFLIGNDRGSGSLTLRESLLISSAGLLLGVVLEGSEMLKSLNGSLAPFASSQDILVALAVTVAFTVLLSLVKIPASFSMVLVGAFAGAVLASSLALDYSRLEEIIAFWVLAPLVAAGLAFVIYNIATRAVSGLGLVTLDVVSRYGVILTSLIVAYVLGANNIGLIYGTMLDRGSPSDLFAVFLTLVAIAGMLAFGRGGVSGTIGDRMLVLSPLGVVSTFLASAALLILGTQFGIPISLTQCLLGGMFGAALSKQVRVVNTRLAVENIGSWVVVPLAAFAVAFLVANL